MKTFDHGLVVCGSGLKYNHISLILKKSRFDDDTLMTLIRREVVGVVNDTGDMKVVVKVKGDKYDVTAPWTLLEDYQKPFRPEPVPDPGSMDLVFEAKPENKSNNFRYLWFGLAGVMLVLLALVILPLDQINPAVFQNMMSGVDLKAQAANGTTFDCQEHQKFPVVLNANDEVLYDKSNPIYPGNSYCVENPLLVYTILTNAGTENPAEFDLLDHPERYSNVSQLEYQAAKISVFSANDLIVAAYEDESGEYKQNDLLIFSALIDWIKLYELDPASPSLQWLTIEDEAPSLTEDEVALLPWETVDDETVALSLPTSESSEYSPVEGYLNQNEGEDVGGGIAPRDESLSGLTPWEKELIAFEDKCDQTQNSEMCVSVAISFRQDGFSHDVAIDTAVYSANDENSLIHISKISFNDLVNLSGPADTIDNYSPALNVFANPINPNVFSAVGVKKNGVVSIVIDQITNVPDEFLSSWMTSLDYVWGSAASYTPFSGSTLTGGVISYVPLFNNPNHSAVDEVGDYANTIMEVASSHAWVSPILVSSELITKNQYVNPDIPDHIEDQMVIVPTPGPTPTPNQTVIPLGSASDHFDYPVYIVGCSDWPVVEVSDGRSWTGGYIDMFAVKTIISCHEGDWIFFEPYRDFTEVISGVWMEK